MGFAIVIKNIILFGLIIVILHFLIKNKFTEKTTLREIKPEEIKAHLKDPTKKCTDFDLVYGGNEKRVSDSVNTNKQKLEEIQKYIFENEHIAKDKIEATSDKSGIDGYDITANSPGKGFAFI